MPARLGPNSDRNRSRPRSPVVVAFTTDFGHADAYAAAMKAAVVACAGPIAGGLQLIDVTHEIPPQDVWAGSILLERAVADFPAGTLHVAVVDPGVGTSRRLLLCRSRDQWILCPDNGLITWTLRRHHVEAAELVWRPAGRAVSPTFHGRDILAPAAGILAAGRVPRGFTRPIARPRLLESLLLMPPGAQRGQVIAFDRYGNATTNILSEALPPDATVRVGTRQIGRVARTYADVKPGRPLALIGSADLLEIAVRNGSARSALHLRVGSPVRLSPAVKPKS